MSLNNVKVVKKDGTKEEFNVQKVVVAVNKSAYRALIKFSQKDIDFICHFVEEKDRKSTRLNSSHSAKSRMPSSA